MERFSCLYETESKTSTFKNEEITFFYNLEKRVKLQNIVLVTREPIIFFEVFIKNADSCVEILNINANTVNSCFKHETFDKNDVYRMRPAVLQHLRDQHNFGDMEIRIMGHTYTLNCQILISEKVSEKISKKK
jgi:hypothetical protein